MMDVHLALGQLWRCPVEWCTVWKGSASDSLAHVCEKHGGSESVVFDRLEKLFPLWTVTRDFWQAALRPDVSGVTVDIRLFQDSRCRLVHKYRVVRGYFPSSGIEKESDAQTLGSSESGYGHC